MLDRCRPDHAADLEAIEMAVRCSMHAMGAVVITKLVEQIGAASQGGPVYCPQGHQASLAGYRSKQLLTILGLVPLDRAYYHCEPCRQGVIPLDLALDISGTSFSPGVRRLMAYVGGKESFEQGREDLEILAGIRVETKQVERVAEGIGSQIEMVVAAEQEAVFAGTIAPMFPVFPVSKLYVAMDGTGVPMITRETAGRVGKNSDQAKTREVKLCCLFTQTTTDEKGRPVRDPQSTTYTGAIESAAQFGRRVYAEAVRRGLERAGQVIVLGDGAVWIRHLTEEHFPSAIQIVDLYHAREHINELASLLFGRNTNTMRRWTDSRIDQLDRGRIEELVASFRRLRSTHPDAQDQLQREIGYFQLNAERMRYEKFRSQGLFVGSGVIEAGCRTIVGQRLKNSGMHWSVRGANAIVHLRCCQISERFEEFWENRASA
jgi:hypothetical protein